MEELRQKEFLCLAHAHSQRWKDVKKDSKL